MAGKLAPIVAWNSKGRFPKVAAFLERSSVETDAMDAAASILNAFENKVTKPWWRLLKNLMGRV